MAGPHLMVLLQSADGANRLTSVSFSVVGRHRGQRVDQQLSRGTNFFKGEEVSMMAAAWMWPVIIMTVIWILAGTFIKHEPSILLTSL